MPRMAITISPGLQCNGAVATKALAHKLARACYRMLREHKPFEVARCFA